MPYCPRCGKEVSSEDSFRQFCGVSLKPVSPIPRKISLSAIAGLVALIYIALPWWSASGSSTSISASPLSLWQLSNGVIIGSILTFPLPVTVIIVVPTTLAVGGALCFIGVRRKIARVLAIMAISAASITFALVMSMYVGLAIIIPMPTSLNGLGGSLSVPALGVYASWGISGGFYLPILSCLLLAASLKWKRLEMPWRKEITSSQPVEQEH